MYNYTRNYTEKCIIIREMYNYARIIIRIIYLLCAQLYTYNYTRKLYSDLLLISPDRCRQCTRCSG